MKSARSIVLLASLPLSLFAINAIAGTVPDATASLHATDQSGPFTLNPAPIPTDYTGVVSNPSPGGSDQINGTIFGNEAPSVSSSVTATFGGAPSTASPAAGITTSLTYYFEIFGPANQSVPVNAQTTEGAYSNVSGGTAQATENLGSLGFIFTASSASNSSLPASYLLEDLQIPSDTLETITIQASSSLPSEEVDASASAYVNSSFVIDTAIPGTNQFTLEFSSSVVPEPASSSLIALSAIGLLARRRRAAR